jgi:hypothetical protein
MENKFTLFCVTFVLVSTGAIAVSRPSVLFCIIVLPIVFVLTYFGLRLGYKFADFVMSIVWPEKK